VARLVEVLAAVSFLAMAQKAVAAGQDAPLERALDRGKTMYLYDRAAWITSDDLLARLPRDRQGEVGGWVVTPAATDLHVDYIGKGQAADRIIYSVDVNGETLSNAIVYPVAAEPTLKALALQMAHALRAAWSEMDRHSDWRPCANARFNTIVLPPGKDRTTPVYFLTPQTEAGSYPFGGHYEVDVADDGKIAFTRAFTHGCISLAKAAQNNGTNPVALMITHLLDPHPTEIHVFEQYYVGLPVFVMTGPKSVWKVEGGRIEDDSAMMTK
jgi:hypothetical protein